MRGIKSLTLLLTVSAALAAYAVKSSRPAMSDEERAQRREERRIRKLQKTGGRIIDYSTMKGCFVFLNAQKRIPSDKLNDIIEGISQFFSSDFKFGETDAAVSIANASEVISQANANAGVIVVEDPNLPTILVAHEAKWAIINVTALAKDGADDAKLAMRTHRELWRAFGYLTGQDSMAPLCLLHTVTSLDELDMLEANSLSEEPLMKAEEGLKKMGIKPFRSVTYRTACEEGWAPAPTNDFQRAIFETIKDEKERGPSNPRPIKFKGKRPPRP